MKFSLRDFLKQQNNGKEPEEGLDSILNGPAEDASAEPGAEEESAGSDAFDDFDDEEIDADNWDWDEDLPDEKNVRRRYLVIGSIAVIAVALLFAVAKYTFDHFRYHSYEVVTEKQGGDNGLALFVPLQDKIIKYSGDGISLMNHDLSTVWNVSLAYSNPQVDVSGPYAVMYDRLGTDISIFNRGGSVSSFRTDLPIVAAKLSEKGNVAVIVDEGTMSYVKYYSVNGTLIADITGGSTDKGNPVDAAVTDNGNTVAVSFLKAGEDGVNAEVAFYRFNQATVTDGNNLIFAETFSGSVIPDLVVSGNRIIALQENGFTVYRTGNDIKKETTVNFDTNIISAFYDDEYIGFIFNGQGSVHRYRMAVYSLTGKPAFETDIDLIYDSIMIANRSVLLYNSSEMAVYNMKGVLRFSGVVSDSGIDQVMSVSRNRYLTSGTTKTTVIQLKLN